MGGEAVWLGSKGRYGSCLVALAGNPGVWSLVKYLQYLNSLEMCTINRYTNPHLLYFYSMPVGVRKLE